MTVLVGYVPNAFGEAALTAAVAEATPPRRAAARGQHVARRRARRRPPRRRASSSTGSVATWPSRASAFEVRQIEEGSDAAEVLLEVADEEDASVLVIGLRHRTPVGKLLLGSTAQRLLLDATCPVLAVKAH